MGHNCNLTLKNLITKLLGIVVLGLLLSTNAFAGKVKPGSGPLKFTEKEVRDFHIYITSKLNGDLIKKCDVEGFSFGFSSKPVYASHYLVTGTYKRIFSWGDDSNRPPEKGLCSGPSCTYFAKKNKIVWKGAKTRISRKTTFGELKVILKDLGFYDGPISEEDKSIARQCE
tara:strand:- start:148 stop:660 length:513 start_codon:yes stop_codon:yes gene_type:complete